jgi:hypothetical protein
MIEAGAMWFVLVLKQQGMTSVIICAGEARGRYHHQRY